MGYRREPKTFQIVIDGEPGLEVKARSLSIGEMYDDKKVFESFADALISWNLEDEDGNPIPTTLEGVQGYPDADFIRTVAKAWLDAVMGVDDELGKGLTSGDTFPEASIPMEPLSPSLVS